MSMYRIHRNPIGRWKIIAQCLLAWGWDEQLGEMETAWLKSIPKVGFQRSNLGFILIKSRFHHETSGFFLHKLGFIPYELGFVQKSG